MTTRSRFIGTGARGELSGARAGCAGPGRAHDRARGLPTYHGCLEPYGETIWFGRPCRGGCVRALLRSLARWDWSLRDR
jgi:hypothetical protein